MNELNFKEVQIFPKKLTIGGTVILLILIGMIVRAISFQWDAIQTIEKRHLPIIERSAINVRLISVLGQQLRILEYDGNQQIKEEIKLNFESLISNYKKLESLEEVKEISDQSFYPKYEKIIEMLNKNEFGKASEFIESSAFADDLENFMFYIFDQTESLSNQRDQEQEGIVSILKRLAVVGALVLILLLYLLTKIYRGYQFNIRERIYAENKARVLSNQRQTLIHVLCHDLGNPVSAIFGLIEVAHLLPEKDKENMIPTIKTNSQAALDIIELTKKMQALETGKLSSQIGDVNLSECVTESLAIFEQKINKKKIVVDNNLDEKVLVKAEKVSLVHSVINNIVSNSVKFLKEDGRIVFSQRIFEGQVEIQISDDGVGMPKDILENLFSETVATSRTGTSGEEGTGFGMPLVKKFMNAYSGDISVSSLEGKGTKTTLVFKA